MPSITKEAKDAVLEALKSRAEERSTFVIPKGDEELCEGIMDGLTEAFAVVESFPISDGWIPVSESPEESRFYLVRCPGFCESGYEVSQFSNGRFGYEWNDLLHEEVTHYQSLPNPPTSHK